MRSFISKHLRWFAIGLLVCAPFVYAKSADSTGTNLPKPKTTGGRPLLDVLNDRQSTRSFSDKILSEQTLSNLLWAAFGVNRPDTGKRTAPSAFDSREIDIYVVTEKGLYLFDPVAHGLKIVAEEDVRALAGGKNAPLSLVYVADFSKMTKARSEENKIFYSAADTGFIAQNVYLFCASEGLGAVVRGGVGDKEGMSKKMGLRPDQRIILAQSVGYPKE